MKHAVAIALTVCANSLAQSPQQVTAAHYDLGARNCGACHTGLPAGPPGPSLTGVARRLNPAEIATFLLAPEARKPGTRHPALFARPDPPANNSLPSPAGSATDQAAALAAYLHSLPLPSNDATELPKGEPGRGESLYETIGCKACHHDVGDDLPPPSHQRLGAPIALAYSYPEDELARYLLEPESALMPSLKLSPQEASDLAAWIKRKQPEARTPPVTRPLTPARVNHGRRLYHEFRCGACHGSPEKDSPPLAARLPIANSEAGCLSDTLRSGIPSYPDPAALREAVETVRSKTGTEQPEARIERFFTTYNCYACHERNGKGGAADRDRSLFTSTDPAAESYGDFGLVPPKLDHLGRKLTRDWLRKILVHGHGEVRPFLTTRMPHFDIPEVEVNELLEALEAADRRTTPITIDVSGLPGHQRGHYGRDLMGSGGLNCITCHGLKGQPALGASSIDLTHTVQRLRPEYFKELLLAPQSVQPGTLMPPLFLNRPKANQEVEQLWTYLKELDQRRLPDGLLRSDDFELKPAAEGRPILLRTFLEGVGTHAIAVGFPEGVHVAFDARSSRWALAWRGRFLDAMSTWDDRYATPAKPLGNEIFRFPEATTSRIFAGFRLDPSGTPVFLYREGQLLIEDRISPHPKGGLVRTLKCGRITTRQRLQLKDGQVTTANEE